ncbi:MAG TPA: PAS domain S-box protein [Candidatus Dormibacteraeota bacterium]
MVTPTQVPARLGILRLLLVEDEENDAILIERQIRRGGYDVEVTRVLTAAAMRDQLQGGQWDLVISDFHLPGSSLEETIAAFRADGRDIPFLLVSGTIGDEAAVKAIKMGANDYLLKGALARLVPAIQREIADAHLRQVAREADAALNLARERLLEETSSRARIFEALHRVAVGVAGLVDMQKVAELTVKEAATLVGADGAILRWYDVESEMLHLLAASGAGGWELAPDVITGELGGAFLNAEATVINDYRSRPGADPAAIRAGVTAMAAVALSVRDRPAGTLAVFARGGDGFSAADLDALGLLGAQVAPALGAGRLHLALQASEQRFKTAFEHSPTGLAISGAGGRYLAVSPALCEMLGYSETELLGLDYFTLTHPDDRPLSRERTGQLSEGKLDGYRVTKRYLHRDGRTVWVELSVAVVRDAAGAVVQLISQAQDITERKQAQDNLTESLAMLEAAQEIGDIGTFVSWLAPERAGLNECSKGCLRIYGRDEAGFDGETFVQSIHPDDAERVRAAKLEALEAGSIYDSRHRIIRPDGAIRWIHERAVNERDAAGVPVRLVGVMRDVTEETLAADALRASEARNAAVIEAAVDCLIVTDTDSKITGFNPAAERLFGYRRLDVLGRNLTGLIVPERFQGAHRAALRAHLANGDRHYLDRRIEMILHRADGSELSAEVSISRFEVDGAPNFSASIRDLTDRDQVIAGRERLADVLNNTPVMLYAYDSIGVVTLAAGRATISLLGVEPGAALGLNAFDLLNDVPEALEHLKRGLAGESFAGTVELASLGIWIESRYSPILDADGRVLGMTGMAIDISDRVKGNQAREESDAKSRLVAVVNHEVRTPLNSILGFTELLLNEGAGPLTDKQKRYAINVEAAGRHLLALVNDSLDLSRIAAGKMDMEIFDLELAPIVDQAAGQIQPLVDSRGLEIRVDAGGRHWVRADRRRLLQVLWNLLSNAIRHTPTGGVITISARLIGTMAEISVKDTGIGIPANQLERIFEEYAQVEGQADGTGLGLPVSRRLAKLMDGDIQVMSEVGVGSTFTITLPRGHTSTA